jgi:SAM-dependent methyltransferase
MTNKDNVWERPERVEEFAKREPDKRMLSLIETIERPEKTVVLDIGCAGGRNTVVLAERGFDVHALDTSEAMIAKTRARVAEVLGREEAAARVVVGDMQDLSAFTSGSVDIVLALGVYHNARNKEQWDRSLTETARVLRPGGIVLVANFSPRSDPDGNGAKPVEGEPGVYIAFNSERMYLVEAGDLDAEMALLGLDPVTPTDTVTKPTDSGQRVTVNGLYRKRV